VTTVRECDAHRSAICTDDIPFFSFAEYGKLCPESSPGDDLIECLEGKQGDLSESCVAWIKMMKGCEEDLGKFCAGNEADAVLCLTQWTKRRDLSEGCAASIPAPPEEEEKPKKKSKASQKRKAHEQAVKEAKARKKAEKKAEKAKKNKKAKKSKKNKKKSKKEL
jgi:hypothetical protein